MRTIEIGEILSPKSDTVLLVLNGQMPRQTQKFLQYHYTVCTDGAYDKLVEAKIIPDLICGDFDSVLGLPDTIETVYLPDQNFTDFEKTLMLLQEKGHRKIDVYAGDGGDLDHFLGNLSIGFKFSECLDITFFNDKYVYWTLSSGCNFVHIPGKIVSLFPFGKVESITTSGLMYPLSREDLDTALRTGTRNVSISNTIQVNFLNGFLSVFIEI